MAEIHTLSPGARILCVDDEPSGLYFRKLILENAGYRVETATNAIDAIRSFRARTFALVITDSLLGRQSGTTMTAEMRQMRPQVPIIVLSGAAEVPSGLGLADAFLSKTEGPEHLLQKVRELLQTPAPAARVSSPARAAAALMEPQVQQILLAALVDSSDDAVFSKTLGGIILTWNRAAERMYGYTAAEMIGKPVAKLVPEEKKGELQGIMQHVRRGEKIDHLETQRIAKDGRILTISLTISPICDAKGNLVGAATTARDITEVRMAEQALRTSDRLAMTGRMAATVAHEINNPLEAVTNILYLLGQSSSLDATAREFLSIAEREVAQIRQIAQLTLKFHRQSSRWGPVSLSELVDSVLALYGRRIRVLGIAVEQECQGECKVEGNATELRQVVSNLIVNAVDALEQRGERLRIRIQDACDGNHRSGVRITIADDGPGIPASHLRSIFQPFYSTKGEKGTGLGLWVSRSIVEKHGGSLRMRSSNRPGRSGTTFSVFFPNEVEVARLKAA